MLQVCKDNKGQQALPVPQVLACRALPGQPVRWARVAGQRGQQVPPVQLEIPVLQVSEQRALLVLMALPAPRVPQALQVLRVYRVLQV